MWTITWRPTSYFAGSRHGCLRFWARCCLLLAASGIYAVVSYTVSLRAGKWASEWRSGQPRAAWSPSSLAENLGVVVAGALAGWLLTFVVALDVIGVDTIDASVFVGVPVLLLVRRCLACWIPARRATLVEPIVVLREE